MRVTVKRSKCPLGVEGLCLVMLFLLPMTGSARESGGGIDFSSDILPIISSRCVICHLDGQEPGNLALTPDVAFETLVTGVNPDTGLPFVDPGKPERSYLLLKLKGTHREVGGRGARMPVAGPPLDDHELEAIASWIREGAENNQ